MLVFNVCFNFAFNVEITGKLVHKLPFPRCAGGGWVWESVRLICNKKKQKNTECTFVTSVIYTWHEQPTRQQLDRFGWQLTVYLGVWWRIDGVLNAQLSGRHAHLWTTPLNYWRFPITDTLVLCNEPLSIQQMSMLSLNNFLNKDGATHYEIFRTQFSCSIRLWKDS